MKLLVLVLVIALVYFIFFKNRDRDEVKKSNKKNKTEKKDRVESMVECSKCGVFTSNQEAIIKNNQFFCSSECANAST